MKGTKSATHFTSSQFKVKHGQTRSTPASRRGSWSRRGGVTTVVLSGGFAPEDSAQSVKCKNACTVVTLDTAEFLSYYSYNQVGICPMVDGYFTNGSCYFSGALSFPELYSNRTNQTNLAVSSGTHTVQTYVYTTAPAYMGHYQNDYHVYE